MFVDISHCSVCYDIELENDCLSQEKLFELCQHNFWVVVQSAKKYPTMDSNFANKSSPFDSPSFLLPSIAQRFEVSDNILLVPLESISRPAFVIPEYQQIFKHYAELDTYERTCLTKNAIAVDPWNVWEKKFIGENENDNITSI